MKRRPRMNDPMLFRSSRFKGPQGRQELAMKFVKRVFLMLLLSPLMPAFAQEFPSRPITMVVPFSAGGPGDVIARLLGTSMSATRKQAVVIENVDGAGGTLGTNRVAKAAP